MPSISQFDFQLTPAITSSFHFPRSLAASTSANHCRCPVALPLTAHYSGPPRHPVHHTSPLHAILPSPLPEPGLGLRCFNQEREGEVLGLSLKKAWPLLLDTLGSSERLPCWRGHVEPSHGEGKARGPAERSPPTPDHMGNTSQRPGTARRSPAQTEEQGGGKQKKYCFSRCSLEQFVTDNP